MKKTYGEEYDLTQIQKGEVVIYRGSRYFVIDSNYVVLELSKNEDSKPGDRSNKFVNKSMFNTGGAIPD